MELVHIQSFVSEPESEKEPDTEEVPFILEVDGGMFWDLLYMYSHEKSVIQQSKGKNMFSSFPLKLNHSDLKWFYGENQAHQDCDSVISADFLFGGAIISRKLLHLQ